MPKKKAKSLKKIMRKTIRQAARKIFRAGKTKKINKFITETKKKSLFVEELPMRIAEQAKKQAISDVKKTKVRVIGIGGGGGSIVSELASKIQKATFVAANTDSQALKSVSRKVIRFQFGQNMTRGLGTGMKGDIAELASQNEKEKIKKLLIGQDLCIFVACLGGGTGSGAVPIFSKIARNLGNISYGIFTLPFKFEGERKTQAAMESLQKLKPHLNAISIIPNDRIFQIVDRNTPLKTALSAVNKHLADSLESLLETIYDPGLINIDFADLKTVFEGRGRLTYLSATEIASTDKNEELAKQILHFPLYDYTIKGAKGILFNVVGGKDLGLAEISQISKIVSAAVNRQAKIILGISQNRDSGAGQKEKRIKVTLLATGCGQRVFAEKQKRTRKKITRKKKADGGAKITQSGGTGASPSKTVKKRKSAAKKIGNKKAPRKIVPAAEATIRQNFDATSAPQPEQERIAIKVRRNALEVKKKIEEEEKEIISQENRWEMPAFLRRKNGNQE